jgi:ribose transport system permease protein
MNRRETPVAVLLVALTIYFSFRVPGFLDSQGLIDCARQYASFAILAVGLTLVIGSGGIDISVGSVVGLSAVVLGVLLTRSEVGLIFACMASIAVGSLFGLANGLGIAILGLQPVVVTLSTMAAARGLAYVLAGQGISSISLPAKAEPLQTAAYISPAPIILALAITVLGSVVLTRTVLGRSILAIGANEKAALLSGIRVCRVKLIVYTLTGTLAGLAGVITTGLMSTATTDAGLGYEFEAITAVLMGGTSIMGGESTVIGSVLGVATAAMLNRGFGLLGLSDHWRMMCLGLILIISVLLDRARKSIVGEEAR